MVVALLAALRADGAGSTGSTSCCGAGVVVFGWCSCVTQAGVQHVLGHMGGGAASRQRHCHAPEGPRVQ